MTEYDEIVMDDAEKEYGPWIREMIDARAEIVAFVDARLNGGGTGTYKEFLRGSFNLSYHIDFGDRRPSVLIRFPVPGESATPWRDEKVANEVRFIEYLRENTSIPLPHIHCWGPGEESPRQLGPFIIMDFIPGTRLTDLLRLPTDKKSKIPILDPNMDDVLLDKVYEQIADYMLQMSRLSFSHIGAISKDDGESGTWTVTGRPLTFNMNILATSTGYPMDQFHTEPVDRASEFFKLVARQHLLHLDSQRNLAKDESDARRRFVARHRFQQLIPKYCPDEPRRSRIFCDDMQASNMLIDPDTHRITAVLDFEFTNCMPAQFACDPPWWLLLRSPGVWIEDHGLENFSASYVPRMEQFLRALARVEEKSPWARGGDPAAEPRLSTRMRESWDTKRFWFNYAARTCLDVDAIYWAALHEDGDGDGLSLLDPETRAKAGPLVQKKMEQLSAYNSVSREIVGMSRVFPRVDLGGERERNCECDVEGWQTAGSYDCLEERGFIYLGAIPGSSLNC